MKKIFKNVVSVLTVLSALSTSAFAETQFINLVGSVEKDALGVTVLMVNKGVSLKEMENKDILWVDQGTINANGSFSLRVPMLADDTYDFYSNALTYGESDPTAKTKTLYVSSNGNDANSGETADAPLKSIAAAFKQADETKEIILLDDAVYTKPAQSYEGSLTIKGNTNAVKIVLNDNMHLAGDLVIDNLVISGSKAIYANGYSLRVESSVTSDARLTVYGGKSGNLTGDTDITLLGGLYERIYGGGNGGTVTGNTNVVLGGNANSGDSIDDSSSAKSPCYVYGGGNNGAVTGKTNVTLQDSAVALYLVGAGSGANGTAKDTNIFIKGGQVMNVYAGSTSTALPAGTVTNITMTGGKAEALFGGCESVGLTGHTFVNVLGGEVTRRVYTGCYNNADFGVSGLSIKVTWSEPVRYVSGTTTLTIGPDAKFNTKSGLSEDNAINVGVFAGSRMETSKSDEINTIIYQGDSYSSHKGYIGEKSSYKGLLSLSSYFKSFANYTVKAGKNGTVYGTTTPGTVRVVPDEGYCGFVGSTKCEAENVQITDGASITFEVDNTPVVDFEINDVQANRNDTNISADVDFAANNISNEKAPKMYAAVYSEDGKDLLTVKSINTTPDMNEHTFDFDYTFETNKSYCVKVMMWNGEGKWLTSQYKFQVR